MVETYMWTMMERKLLRDGNVLKDSEAEISVKGGN